MTVPVHPSAFAAIGEVVAARRTRKAFNGSAVDRATVEQLLELARWAPTHRMHQPWRFAVLDQPAIHRLIGFLQSDPAIAATPDPAKAQAKLAKLLERLPGASALIQTTWVRHPDPAIDLEDHAAAAAAVQNILLGATALGLASYWSTTAALAHPATLRWCGCDPARESHLACIWLGGSTEDAPPPPRKPLAEIARFL
ncbi:MAG: nitroreductase family protein [Planctomycetes bacterium]|nr:nitroreductase family protein [Planctomycetota bacterium]